MKTYLQNSLIALIFNAQISYAAGLPENVFSALIKSKEHTTIAKLSDASRLEKVEKGSEISVFAPTDTAFAKVSKKFLDPKLNPQDQNLRQSILKHHAILTPLKFGAIKDGQKLMLADGENVILNFKAGKYSVNQLPIKELIQTKKGIVFVVDTILLPANVKVEQIAM